MTGYNNSSRIIIDHTKVGGDLTNYPLYIDLSNFNDNFWLNVQDGGGDIRITTSDGITECPREIVSCDTTLKTGEVHALIPNVSASVDTVVYVYYGNPIATDYLPTDTYGSQAVWGTGTNLLISHLKGNLIDSSLNSRTATLASNATLTTDRFGRVNKAYLLNNVDVEQKIYIPNSQGLFESGDLSFDIWCSPENVLVYQYIFDHFNWRFIIETTSGLLRYRFAIGRFTDGAGPAYTLTSDILPINGTWVKLSVVYHEDTIGGNGYVKFFVNGILKATQSIGYLALYAGYGSNNVNWGNSSHGNAVPFNGKVGESKIRPIIISDGQQLTEYNNQNDPGTFYSVINQQSIIGISSITGINTITF